MLKQLEQSLRRHNLVRAGQRVGVAVSGGADSTALLRALAALAPELGVVLVVLHLNHRLRGKESDADQSFVASLAEQFGLEAVIGSADVAADKPSVEAAGRRARYAFFLRAAADHHLDSVATAHTRDDQAETVLLRLLRGSGTSGLAGIHREADLSALARSPIHVSAHASAPPPRLIRPLLSIGRRQVESYLLSLGQPFRQDPSNLDTRYLRNRIRAQLLPLLERNYNPQLRQALCETAEVAAAENACFDELISSVIGHTPDPEGGMEIAVFQAQPVALQRRILRRLCQSHGLALDFAQLEGMRDFALAGAAGSLQLPRGYQADMVRHAGHPLSLLLRSP